MNVYIPPIIEKVYNVQGSTAAPGSGEYHRYRALRRKERTIAATMEKEYNERKLQKDFDENKELKKEIIQEKREKKKRRRENKIKKNKLIKKIKKENKEIFDKNKPIIDQIKEELTKEEFENIIIKKNEDKDEHDYNINFLNKKSLRRNNDINEVSINNEVINIDHSLDQIFPREERKLIQFDNYDEYEQHLEAIKILEKYEKVNKDDKNENKSAKKEQNIIIVDEDY